MTYYDKYRYLTTLDAAEDENDWWVVGYEVNGIFRVSKQEGVIHFLKKTESSDVLVRRYRYSFKYKGKIYFFPMFSRNIEVYDIESETFHIIKMTGDSSNMYATIGYIVKDEYIYLFSAFCNENPVRINTDTMVCEEVCDVWTDTVVKYKKNKKWFICSVTEVQDDIWYGVYETNILIRSSIKAINEIEVIRIDEKYSIYRVEYVGNNKLLITMTDGDVCIIYNIADGAIEFKISIKQIGVVVNVLSKGEEVILIPQYGKKIMLVNRDTGVSRIINCNSEKMRCFSEVGECFYYGKIDEEKIYLYPYNTNVLTIINRKDMSITYQEWIIDKDSLIKDIMTKYVIEDKDGVYYEKRCDIDNFLENIL